MSEEQKSNQPQEQPPQPTKKRVDEDWKRKAREEAAKLDAQKAAAEPAVPGEPTAPPGEPPSFEARFDTLIQSFATEALIALGDIENPYTGQRERNFAHAKYAIDMLQLISDKTQNNLTADEKKLLDGALFDLRMRFLRR